MPLGCYDISKKETKSPPRGYFFCFDLVVARAYWVMGCRVAELLHANPDAKQNTRSRNESKTLVPLASKTNHSKNTREFFQHEPAPMLIVKGSRVFVSRFFVLSQFVPRHHRRTRGLWRAAAHRPSTAPQPSTAQPHTLHAGALQVAPRPPSLTSFSAPRAAPVKARVATGVARLALRGASMVLLPFAAVGRSGSVLLSGSPSGANGQAAQSTNSYNAPPGRVGRSSNKGLERRPRRTAGGSEPEHQDTPRLFPSPSC